MGRVNSFVLLVLCLAAALSATTVNADDPWFPGWGWSDSPPPPVDSSPPPLYPSPTSPSPYYDAPPYDAPPPSADSSPPYYGPVYFDEDFEALETLSDAPSLAPTDDPRYAAAPFYATAPAYAATPIYADAPFYSAGFLASSLVENPDQWPEPWTPLTTVNEAFGDDAEKVYGDVSLLDGLSSKGHDGYSQLLKEGITALLNALDEHFKITEDEVKKCFSFKTALSSESAAAEQAHTFADANELYATAHA